MAAVTGAVVAGAVAIGFTVVTITGGAAQGAPGGPAVGYTTAGGVAVYGQLGPEGVPLEIGPALAPADQGLTGAVVDGISCNTTEQLAYHHHIHLAIFVDGHPYSVPYGVGMVAPIDVLQTAQGPFAEGSASCLYWTHVHAQDGIVHIESPVAQNFTLGQALDIWHVPLTPGGIAAFKGPVTVTVNGKPYSSDPRQIPLTQHSQLVINVGGPIVKPPPISWVGTGL
jgi:hypothetical protein